MFTIIFLQCCRDFWPCKYIKLVALVAVLEGLVYYTYLVKEGVSWLKGPNNLHSFERIIQFELMVEFENGLSV